jgi:hypothetical protein
MNNAPFTRAFTDLFWIFFPVVIVMFILALVGRLDSFLQRTDLILTAAVLFAEGFARSRRLPKASRGFFQYLGFFATLITVTLASMMLLVEVGGITQLAPVVESGRFTFLRYLLLLGSIPYSLLIRAIDYSRELPTPSFYRDY